MRMQVSVLGACLAFIAASLHGCGGGGGDGGGGITIETTTATTTTTLALNEENPFTFGMKDDNIQLEISWGTRDLTDQGLDKLLEVNVTGKYPADDKYTVGWFSVGWSPDGSMANGDYVFAFPGCVKAFTNTKLGSAPTKGTDPPFDVYYPTMSIDGTGFKLSFLRPFFSTTNNLTPKGNRLLIAAGSPAKTPADCDTKLSFSHKHDLGTQGYVQSPEALFVFPDPDGENLVV